MSAAGSMMALVLMVAAILVANAQPRLAWLFRWLPVPLWCYALPMIAVAVGWLPQHDPIYPALTNQLLPLALALLLLGVDLISIIRTGPRALLAAGLGAVGIIAGAAIGVVVLRAHLPAEAWKGAATLAATWTGGTMNLLALRTMLNTPDPIFAPLIIVDAMIAYSWMALLVAISGWQHSLDRWFGVNTSTFESRTRAQQEPSSVRHWRSLLLCTLMALSLALGARALAAYLPTSQFVSSSAGWIALLVTTGALSLSLIPWIRRVGGEGSTLGYPCLYVVLAATGAQASLSALWSAPMWILLGVIIVVTHAIVLLVTGRLWHLPLGLLATASQANIGGVVSTPLVAAVYSQDLAPIGLLLAIAGNAVGTYLGLGAATLCQWATRVMH